jgi:hypothetical protein
MGHWQPCARRTGERPRAAGLRRRARRLQWGTEAMPGISRPSHRCGHRRPFPVGRLRCVGTPAERAERTGESGSDFKSHRAVTAAVCGIRPPAARAVFVAAAGLTVMSKHGSALRQRPEQSGLAAEAQISGSRSPFAVRVARSGGSRAVWPAPAIRVACLFGDGLAAPAIRVACLFGLRTGNGPRIRRKQHEKTISTI